MSDRFPDQFFQAADANGLPISGARLFFYRAGTSTKKDTYADSAKTIANANPVVADAAGRFGDIFMLTDELYKVVYAPAGTDDPPTSTIKTADNYGPVQPNPVTKTEVLAKSSAYTVQIADRNKMIAADASSGAFTVTLPAAATAGNGFVIGVKKIDSSANAVTIDGAGAESIDSDTTFLLDEQNDVAFVTSDGTQWRVTTATVGVPPLTKNLLINGNFDIWQRGTSFAIASDEYTADRWIVAEGAGGTATVTRQAFTVGQTAVPNEPRYFLRHDQTVGATGGPEVRQRIEGVRSFAGRAVTLSFWAKAGASVTVTPFATQNFGTGGTPSTAVQSVGSVKTLTTAWQKFTQTFVLPSISGKTLGSDENDYVAIGVEFPNTSTYTIDLAQWQLESGSTATAFDIRPIQQEIARAERFYQKSYNLTVDPATVTDQGAVQFKAHTTAHHQEVPLRTRMRAQPAITAYSTVTGATANWRDATAGADRVAATDARGETGFAVTLTATVDGNVMRGHWVAVAEL